jgi:hypothetical protein
MDLDVGSTGAAWLLSWPTIAILTRLRRECAVTGIKFRTAIEHLPRPLSIFDVGGTQAVWETIGFADQPDVRSTLINVQLQETFYRNIVSIRGDAKDMQTFGDGQFDVVYSNSVIERVGATEDMRRMAQEIKRVGKRYYIQIPYLYFPIEPHFVFPLFQFLPIFNFSQFRGEFFFYGISISVGSTGRTERIRKMT